jgi:hypothetical protein
MCNKETHTNLSKPAHFMRHSLEVEIACNKAKLCKLGDKAIEQALIDEAAENSREALLLADSYVTPECINRLQLVSAGNLLDAA